MNVYTYYAPVAYFGPQDSFIRSWAATWSRQGWNPVVLEVDTARKHPAFDLLKTKVAAWPSINPDGYDLACWQRWLAFDVMGGGVLTDYDVLNMALKPEEVILGRPLILEQHRVPCAIAADEAGAKEITKRILDHVPRPRDGHYSDMYFFQDGIWPHTRTCREYGGVEWQQAKLLHFSQNACRVAGKSKLQLIHEHT